MILAWRLGHSRPLSLTPLRTCRMEKAKVRQEKAVLCCILCSWKALLVGCRGIFPIWRRCWKQRAKKRINTCLSPSNSPSIFTIASSFLNHIEATRTNHITFLYTSYTLSIYIHHACRCCLHCSPGRCLRCSFSGEETAG
jgi:hypothetical protein